MWDFEYNSFNEKCPHIILGLWILSPQILLVLDSFRSSVVGGGIMSLGIDMKVSKLHILPSVLFMLVLMAQEVSLQILLHNACSQRLPNPQSSLTFKLWTHRPKETHLWFSSDMRFYYSNTKVIYTVKTQKLRSQKKEVVTKSVLCEEIIR